MDETRRALTLVCVCLQCPVASAYSAISRSAGPEDVGAPMPLGGDGARRRPDIRHGAVSGVGPCPFFVYLMCGQRQRRSRLTARLTITRTTKVEGGSSIHVAFFRKPCPTHRTCAPRAVRAAAGVRCGHKSRLLSTKTSPAADVQRAGPLPSGPWAPLRPWGLGGGQWISAFPG